MQTICELVLICYQSVFISVAPCYNFPHEQKENETNLRDYFDFNISGFYYFFSKER
jgi:hypothetical protein